jgi:hypothetical protein
MAGTCWFVESNKTLLRWTLVHSVLLKDRLSLWSHCCTQATPFRISRIVNTFEIYYSFIQAPLNKSDGQQLHNVSEVRVLRDCSIAMRSATLEGWTDRLVGWLIEKWLVARNRKWIRSSESASDGEDSQLSVNKLKSILSVTGTPCNKSL